MANFSSSQFILPVRLLQKNKQIPLCFLSLLSYMLYALFCILLCHLIVYPENHFMSVQRDLPHSFHSCVTVDPLNGCSTNLLRALTFR